MRSECCLQNIGSRHPNLVISRFQINFAKKFCPMEFIQQFFNDLNWKLVGYCGLIEGPIIHTKPLTPVFLSYQQHWARVRASARLNNSCLQRLFYEFFNLRLLKVGISVRSNRNWSSSQLQSNRVLSGSGQGKADRRFQDVLESAQKEVEGWKRRLDWSKRFPTLVFCH